MKKKQDTKKTRIKPEQPEKAEPVNAEHQRLKEWFRTVKFRKVMFGGVDEVLLWKKLEELDGLYDAAIRAERARYDALLADYKERSNAALLKYRKQFENGRTAQQDVSPEREEQP